jgi:diacylglycerol O-acyltransferase
MTDQLPRHLSASDSVAWRIEANPLLRSTITLVLRLDQAPDHELLRARLEEASRVFPRLRQRVREIPFHASPPVWADDADFDLDYHVRRVGAGGARTYRDVLDFAASQAMQAFDRERPLWEWTTVEGLADGSAAAIVKIHHSVTDGVGGMRLMAQLFDTERVPSYERVVDVLEEADPIAEDAASLFITGATHQASRLMGTARRFAGKALGAAADPVGSADATAKGLASTARLVAPASAPLSPIMVDRSPRLHFDSFSLPLAALKAAALRVDGKVNDAFMTATAIGLRLYHEHHGSNPDSLRVNMPINLRSEGDTAGGNNWAPARFVVPLAADGGVDNHMREMHDVVVAQRAEPALAFAANIAAVMDQLPGSVLTKLFTGMLTCLDFAATNVPGVPFPLYLAGARIENQDAFAPPSGAAVNVALVTYMGTASIALNMDPAAVPDPDVLIDCMKRGFERVVNPAGSNGHGKPAPRKQRAHVG